MKTDTLLSQPATIPTRHSDYLCRLAAATLDRNAAPVGCDHCQADLGHDGVVITHQDGRQHCRDGNPVDGYPTAGISLANGAEWVEAFHGHYQHDDAFMVALIAAASIHGLRADDTTMAATIGRVMAGEV